MKRDKCHYCFYKEFYGDHMEPCIQFCSRRSTPFFVDKHKECSITQKKLMQLKEKLLKRRDIAKKKETKNILTFNISNINLKLHNIRGKKILSLYDRMRQKAKS